MDTEKISKQTFTIRLHKDISKYDDVIKTDLLNSNDWKDYTKTSIAKKYGNGKIYLSPAIKNTPNWKNLLSTLSNKRAKVSENLSSKALIVFKLTSSKETKFVSISIGYGDSMIDRRTVVNDFGKVIASKLIKDKDLMSIDTTEITDIILQSSRQIIGTKRNSIHSVLGTRSEFPRRIQGSVKNGETEINIVGHNDSLKVAKLMKLEQIASDLEFYVSIYENDKLREANWAKRFTEITAKTVKDQLTYEFASSILKQADFAIAWPYVTEEAEYKITGIYKNNENISEDLSITYLNCIKKRKIDPDKLIAKFKTDYLINIDSNGREQKVHIMKALIGDVVFKKKRYLLFNGSWFLIAQDFYDEIMDEFVNVTESSLPFIKHKKGNYETTYNDSLVKSWNENKIECKELHLSSYTNSAFARGGIEPADLVTKQKDFIYIKKGDSSANLSHLFLQGEVSAQLISEDSNLRKSIADSCFGENWLNEKTPKESMTIVFGIIRNTHILPFFSMISFVEVVRSIRNMNFNVQIAWIDIID